MWAKLICWLRGLLCWLGFHSKVVVKEECHCYDSCSYFFGDIGFNSDFTHGVVCSSSKNGMHSRPRCKYCKQ